MEQGWEGRGKREGDKGKKSGREDQRGRCFQTCASQSLRLTLASHFPHMWSTLSQDFLEMLPLPVYTHPTIAPLNLATMLPAWANLTDLGPKTYIASGQVSERVWCCC